MAKLLRSSPLNHTHVLTRVPCAMHDEPVRHTQLHEGSNQRAYKNRKNCLGKAEVRVIEAWRS